MSSTGGSRYAGTSVVVAETTVYGRNSFYGTGVLLVYEPVVKEIGFDNLSLARHMSRASCRHIRSKPGL